jgi:outer membrane protein TolC
LSRPYENNKTEKAVRNQIKARLARSYTEFFSTSRQLSIAKLELEYYEYMSGVQKNLYKSGKITKNTADIAAIDLMSAKNAVSTYERMLKTAKINIAFILSCYDETQYSIIAQKPIMATEFKTNPGLVKSDIVKSDDYLVSLFLKTNMDLLRLENEIGLEKEYLNNCLNIWEDDSEEAVVQRLLIEQKEMEYEQKKADFTLVVLNSYAEYENLHDKYLFSAEKSKVYEESRRINRVLFSEGRISEQEFRQNDMRYAEEIFSAENDYLALIVSVNDLKLIEQGVLPEG